MKKGLSLVALVATVVVISILITTVTVSGVATSNNAKKISFASEISMIKEAVDSYMMKSNGEFPTTNMVQMNITNVGATSIDQFSSEIGYPTSISLFQIDYKLLGLKSLKYGLGTNGANDIYAMSRETNNIYYAKGLSIGNKTYYALTDDLKETLKYTSNQTDSLSKDRIVFIPSKTGWTNGNIDLTVKIPTEYKSKSVTVNSVDFGEPSISGENGYDIYNISSLPNNSIVLANYTIGSQSVASSRYLVSNIDTVNPSISLDANQILIKDQTKNTAYIKINSKNDNLSGIKFVKYENENISSDIQTYFRTNGKLVSKDIINIDKNVKQITVYIEDNAGNYFSQLINIDSYVQAELLKDITVSKTYVKDGLLLYYDGINNTGGGHSDNAVIWKDLSGNNNDGILTNFNYTSTSGWLNDYLQFDGTDDSVKVPNIGILTNLTFELCIYSPNNVGNITWTNGANTLILYPSASAYVQSDSGSKAASTNFDVNDKYVTLTVVYNVLTQQVYYYQNCILKNTVSLPASSLNFNFTTGQNIFADYQSLNFKAGNVYSVRVYNRALSDLEVKQNYLLDKERFGI